MTTTETNTITQTQLLTPADVAEQIGMHADTIRRYARRGLIPSVRLGASGRRIGLDPSVIDQVRYEA
jgi:excisionase family DNA binding protein